MTNSNVIPLQLVNPASALAMAHGWVDRLSEVVKMRNMGGIPKPTVEIEYTDEGDWSLSIESGSHIYMIHPCDRTYRRFTVLRQTWTDVEMIVEGVPLDAALGRCA